MSGTVWMCEVMQGLESDRWKQRSASWLGKVMLGQVR